MEDDLPLDGLKVIDFTRLLPGPYASLVLADLGADVVKVESPKGGDYLRWIPPLDGKLSYGFKALNSGKRSLAVDLKRPEGVVIARKLAEGADILLESFRPGVMARLGLGYDELKKLNPRLIYCAISGYGQDGPYRDRAGHDLNYQALAGVLGMAGPRHSKPALPAAQLADLGAGALFSLTGILAALYRRERRGEGEFIDVSMTDGSLAFLHMALAGHLGGGAPAPERGGDTLTGGVACYDIYETKDGRYMAFAALEPKFWVSFCQAVKRPDLLSRQFGRAAQIEQTREDLATLFKSKTQDEWVKALSSVDACCEPVLAPGEVQDHPLHVARKNIIEDASGMKRLRSPLRPASASPPGPAPVLGSGTTEVLRELGYRADDIESLAREGVILYPGET